jgi:hypothetical protein
LDKAYVELGLPGGCGRVRGVQVVLVDVRLRAAMVLMFISGFIKYVGHTYCLYTTSPMNIGDITLCSLSLTISLQDAKAKDIPVHKARENIK